MTRVLDLFCGAGGASAGYARLGWEVVGVDIRRQPRYPYRFLQGDALHALDSMMEGHGFCGYLVEDFDFIHASPPCQAYSVGTLSRGEGARGSHPNLIAPVRDLLVASGVPYVIENVVGAPLIDPVVLCGSMFGLDTKRHRLFETSHKVGTPPACDHNSWTTGRPVGVYGHTGGKSTGITSGNHGWLVEDWRRAMDIDWMSRNELAQSIPPAYTEWIGKEMSSWL